MTQHTKEYTALIDTAEWDATLDCGCKLVRLDRDDYRPVVLWHCRLHKAAPELLEALKATFKTLDAYGISSFRNQPVLTNALAAIAKATK